jgi:hypothetical protein
MAEKSSLHSLTILAPPFSDIRGLRERCWFNLEEIVDYTLIHCPDMIGLSRENGEMADLATLNFLDIAKLNEFMVIFRQFIKCVKENFISCFDILPMFQKLQTNL